MVSRFQYLPQNGSREYPSSPNSVGCSHAYSSPWLFSHRFAAVSSPSCFLVPSPLAIISAITGSTDVSPVLLSPPPARRGNTWVLPLSSYVTTGRSGRFPTNGTKPRPGLSARHCPMPGTLPILPLQAVCSAALTSGLKCSGCVWSSTVRIWVSVGSSLTPTTVSWLFRLSRSCIRR